MKYEITKGSEKDFDGAPEWATLLLKGRFAAKAWASSYSNGAKALTPGTTYKYIIDAIEDCTIIAERRPITEPVVNQQLTTEWDGEGLPPVGVECEWLDNRETYVPVKIMYSSKDAVVIRGRSQAFNEDVDIPLDPVFEPARCKFRPIRSPEDVARSNAIGEMERAYEELTGNPAREAEEYYDLIAAGKIPGVTLEGK